MNVDKVIVSRILQLLAGTADAALYGMAPDGITRETMVTNPTRALYSLCLGFFLFHLLLVGCEQAVDDTV